MARFRDSIDAPGEWDFFQFDLIGQVDYVATALGVSNAGGSLTDPLVALFDGAGNLLTYIDDSLALGADPLLQFQAPSSGTYFLGVTGSLGAVGDYTFVLDQAGPPIFFGSDPGSTFL